MTKYREIIRLAGSNLSQTNIALSYNASKTTVNKVLKAAREQNLVWPLDPKLSDPVLGKLLFPEVRAKPVTSKRDFASSLIVFVASLDKTGLWNKVCKYSSNDISTHGALYVFKLTVSFPYRFIIIFRNRTTSITSYSMNHRHT